MSLLELLLVSTVLALALGLLAKISSYVQTQSKQRLAEDMVLTLREALVAYREATGQFPRSSPDSAATGVLAMLLLQDASRQVLKTWSSRSRERHLEGPQSFLDPWGQPFRLLTASSARADLSERVRADAGVPIFESAGPDGRFGDSVPHRRHDNVASDTALMMWSDP